MTAWMISWTSNWMTAWLTNWLTERLTEWLTAWLTKWPVDCLAIPQVPPRNSTSTSKHQQYFDAITGRLIFSLVSAKHIPPRSKKAGEARNFLPVHNYPGERTRFRASKRNWEQTAGSCWHSLTPERLSCNSCVKTCRRKEGRRERGRREEGKAREWDQDTNVDTDRQTGRYR